MPTRETEIWQLVDARGIGGIETHILNLTTALVQRGFKARIMPLRDRGRTPFWSAVKQAGLPTGPAISSWGALVERLLHHPVLLHTHGYRAGLEGRSAALVTATPCVSTYHSGDPGRGKVRLYSWLDEVTARWSNAVSVSDDISLRLSGPSARIDNFVDLPETPSGTGARSIGYVGRLSEEKGADRLIQIAHECPDQPILVFGDGPLRTSLEQNAPRNLHILGHRKMTPETWTMIGLLCMPSRHEGLPLAALEAMSHGIPVCAFSVGGLPRLIHQGKNGWLAPPDGMEELAVRLKAWDAMCVEARRGMGLAARQVVAETYTAAAQLPRLIEVYDAAWQRRVETKPFWTREALR